LLYIQVGKDEDMDWGILPSEEQLRENPR